ncbi:MAG: SUMF1/EgtB/PvdO family nonheme iron enzyme [Pseudomonadota bacterium]
MQRFSLAIRSSLPAIAFALAGGLWTEGVQGQEEGASQDPPAREEERIRRLGDSLTVAPEEEWVPQLNIDTTRQRINELLAEASALEQSGQLVLPRSASAADRFLEILDLEPGQGDAAAGLARVVDDLRARATAAVDAGDFDTATPLIDRLDELAPGDPAVTTLRGAGLRSARIQSIRDAAQAAETAGTFEGDDGAIARYRALLELETDDPGATDGLARIAAQLGEAARTALDGDALDEALRLDAVAVSAGAVSAAQSLVGAAETTIERRIESPDPASAEGLLEQLRAAAPDRAAALAPTLARAIVDAAFPPGERFSVDALGSAAMIVILPDDGERVALAETEISVATFGRFVEATGYRTDAERDGSSIVFDADTAGFARADGVTWRDDYLGEPADAALPVVHVSWNDAVAFVEWLSAETGETFRLPYHAEHSFATAAGTSTRYWWGRRSPEEPVENLAGLRDSYDDDTSWTAGFSGYADGYWGPAPVDAFPPNPLGFRSLAGNVMEWSADCYEEACERRTILGGSWNSQPERAEAESRSRAGPTERSAFVGFRVVRELYESAE